MVPPSNRDAPKPEDLFADFLERVEGGEVVDFEEWVAAHGAQAAALRRIHARWRAMTVAFATMSQAAAGTASIDRSASLTGLLERLQSGGDRWTRYAIGAELARGSMGRVVVAWDRELRRDVALKLQRDRGEDGRMRRRFVEEAQIAAQLDHPGIVPIHELGIDADGRPFFAMRLVRGRDLGVVLELVRTGAEGWSRTRVLHVLLRVCEAMAYAHYKGVVHRDLKPANVMVGRFGETYVMDWGLARVLASGADTDTRVDTLRADIADEDDGSPLLTHTGDVVGTPAYMAPELAAGGAAAPTVAADVYALGAILYHLLAGAPPYVPQGGAPAGASASAALAALRAGPPLPLPDSAPAELRAICERAMARSPGDRYPGVVALADDLRAFLELRVVSAYSTGRFAELGKWIARNRALAGLSAGFVALLLVGIATTAALWWSAAEARNLADATAGRLAVELDRSQFRNARLAMRSGDASNAGEALWQHHLEGRMPRATRWSLLELAERNPLLATRPMSGAQALAFSPPAAMVLVTSTEGPLQAFAPDTLAPLRSFGREGAQFTVVAASPQQPWAVVGDRDGELTVLDLQTGAERRRSRPHGGAIECLECAPDGRAFVSSDSLGTALWWPDAAAEPVKLGSFGDRATGLAIDAAGGRVAVGTASGRLVVVTTAGQQLLDLQIGGDQLLGMSFAPNGRDLWVGSRSISIVDLEASKVRRTLPSRNGTCRVIVHDIDGSAVVGGWWRIDRLTDDPTTQTALALVGSWRLDLDPVGRRIFSKRSGASLDVVDVAQRDLRWFPGGHGAIALAGDGRTATTWVGADAVRRDLATGRETGRLHFPTGGWLIADHSGDRLAVVARGPGGIAVADFGTSRVLYRLDGPEETPFNESAVFSPDGTQLAVVVGEDLVRIHSAANGAVLRELATPEQRILRLRYSGDGEHLAVAFRQSRSVRVFDLAHGIQRDVAFDLPSAEGSGVSIAAVALDRDGSRVAVGTWGGALGVQDVRAPGQRSFQSHFGTTWSLAFLPTDPNLLVGSVGSGGITFWDLDSGEACFQPARLPGPVSQLQISDDGRTLACHCNTGPVAVDLEYRERHVAGLVDDSLAPRRDRPPVSPARELELRQWAKDVLARPWPRWQ